MGWFGFGPLDGDDGMDLRDLVFDLINISFDPVGNTIQSNDEIRILLETNQEMIYDTMRDYDFDRHLNPGFMQRVYIQALAYIMCEYGVKINDRGKDTFIKFIDDDTWALENEERKQEMITLKNRVLEN